MTRLWNSYTGSALSAAFSLILFCPACCADQQTSSAASGDFNRSGNSTGNQTAKKFNRSLRTGAQNPVLQQTSTTGLSIVFGPVGRNFLPPTRLDSFVTEAKENAELIYGDEGTDGPPPYFEFTKEHRIGRGITGARSTGLTTGLGSYLPDAWGGDEWVKGPEFDTSSSGRSAYATTQLLLQDLMMPPPPQGPVPDILPALPQNVTGALSGF